MMKKLIFGTAMAVVIFVTTLIGSQVYAGGDTNEPSSLDTAFTGKLVGFAVINENVAIMLRNGTGPVMGCIVTTLPNNPAGNHGLNVLRQIKTMAAYSPGNVTIRVNNARELGRSTPGNRPVLFKDLSGCSNVYIGGRGMYRNEHEER